RDQHCRTPWCDAAIRDIDHVTQRHRGGATNHRNGRGTCTRCNQAREAPGWGAAVTSGPDARHEVTLTTPTGHRYSGGAPPLLPGEELPGSGPALASRAGPRATRAG